MSRECWLCGVWLPDGRALYCPDCRPVAERLRKREGAHSLTRTTSGALLPAPEGRRCVSCGARLSRYNRAQVCHACYERRRESALAALRREGAQQEATQPEGAQ